MKSCNSFNVVIISLILMIQPGRLICAKIYSEELQKVIVQSSSENLKARKCP